jgi:hypothetical protein
MPVDRNAISLIRNRRNSQRIKDGAITESLSTTGGLQRVSGLLGIKLDTNPGLVLASSGLKVKVNATTPGLTLTANGLAAVAGDGTISITASGITVNPEANGGLVLNSGLMVRGFRSAAGTASPLANGDTWYNTTNLRPTMRRAGFTCTFPTVADQWSTGTAIVSTAAKTSFGRTTVVTANALALHEQITIRFAGAYTSTGSPTLTLEGWFNSNTGTATGAFTAFTAAASGKFNGEITLAVAGTGGPTATISGWLIADTSTGIQMFQCGTALGATVAYSTSNPTVDLTATWSASSASNSVNISRMSVHVL